MVEHSLEEITALTEEINAQVAQEYALFGFPDPPELSRGVVRAAWEVFRGRIPPRMVVPEPVSVAEPGVSLPYTLTAGNGLAIVEDPQPLAVSEVNVGEDRPSEHAALSMNDDDFRQAVIDEIRHLQHDKRYVPSIANWNRHRDARFPSASGVCNRLHVKWLDLLGAATVPTVIDLARSVLPRTLAEVDGLEGEEEQAEKETLVVDYDNKAPIATYDEDLTIGLDDGPDIVETTVMELGAVPPMKVRTVPDSADERSNTLWKNIYALQDMAKDGVIPSRQEWDANRAAGMLSSEALIARYDLLDWVRVAEYADLEPERKRRGRPRLERPGGK